jgi:hypothetical protein
MKAFFPWTLNVAEWSVPLPGHFTPEEVAPDTLWRRGWVGPRVGLDVVDKRKILHPPESNPDHLANSPSLYRLSYTFLKVQQPPFGKPNSTSARETHDRCWIQKKMMVKVIPFVLKRTLLRFWRRWASAWGLELIEGNEKCKVNRNSGQYSRVL